MNFDLFNKTADMMRPVADYDDMGGVIYNLVNFSGTTHCRISPGVPSEISSGPTEYAEATTMVYVLPGLTYQRDDEVHHGAAVYKVLGVIVPSVPDYYTKLVCKETSSGV